MSPRTTQDLWEVVLRASATLGAAKGEGIPAEVIGSSYDELARLAIVMVERLPRMTCENLDAVMLVGLQAGITLASEALR